MNSSLPTDRPELPESACDPVVMATHLLNAAFPFHIGIDAAGKIAEIGASLPKVLPEVRVGDALFDHLTIEHPSINDDLDRLLQSEDSMVLLRGLRNPDLQLRSQLYITEQRDRFWFLASPWVTRLSALKSLGLTLQDFPIHSPMSDLLLLVRAQHVSLEDSTRLAAELRESNERLEKRVDERTHELQVQAASLEYELIEKERMEIELRHAQKMEAVGQLAAGIAHEINTPIHFIGNSIEFLDTAMGELMQLADWSIASQAALSATGDHVEMAGELAQAIEDADVEYIRERMPQALRRAHEGLSRVTHVVSAMREFAHPDRRDKVPADINHAIQTTLTVACNEYKYIADVETQYGELPEVVCLIGDINQVLLNMVVNAAHAIADRVGDSGERGTIRISTAHMGGFAQIMISDDGVGIPEEVRYRIFDPFYTTKEPGRGTGQGLAISHRIIVEQHGGSIAMCSECGKGTTFTIMIPIAEIQPDAGNQSPGSQGSMENAA